MKLVVIFSLLMSFMAPVSAASLCADSAYKQFDFWLGNWQVTNPTNDNVSQSKISKIIDGCVIFEEYSTPTGYQGKSLNIYDKTRDVWHQTWTDNSGMLLLLEGSFEDGAMVLEGQLTNDKGEISIQRITWRALTANKVSQIWQQSIDGGKTWQTLFDGTYRRVD